ncbi:MAG TPA: hypothetical protein VGD09_02345 [Blastococcus sp.]
MPSTPPSRGPRVRVPGPALAAGVLGVVAAAALALVLLAVLGLARWGEDAVASWLIGLLLVPPLQVVAAVVLLCRRGWLPLALTSVPGVLLSGYLLLSSVPTGDIHLASPVFVCVVLPVPVLVLTLLPATRVWAAHTRA